MHPRSRPLRHQCLAPTILALILATGSAVARGGAPSATAGPAGATFEPGVAHAGAVLLVHGPSGIVWSGSFTAGEPIFFPLESADGARLADGEYLYELRLLDSDGRETMPEALAVVARLSGVLEMSGGVPLPLAPPASADFEIVDGVPDIRLTDTSGTARVWDIRSVADNFEIVDQTPVIPTIPFEIEGGAPTGSIYVDNNQRIALHRVALPLHPLQVGTDGTNGNGAYLTVGGVWTDNSSRASKQDIRLLGLEESLAAVIALEPVEFAYRGDPGNRYAGFIAEDVPELVATPDRTGLAPMDIVAVLTRVVQEQQLVIQHLADRLAELEAGAAQDR